MPHDVDADDEQRKGLLTPLARVSGDRRQIVLPKNVPDRAREILQYDVTVSFRTTLEMQRRKVEYQVRVPSP